MEWTLAIASVHSFWELQCIVNSLSLRSSPARHIQFCVLGRQKRIGLFLTVITHSQITRTSTFQGKSSFPCHSFSFLKHFVEKFIVWRWDYSPGICTVHVELIHTVHTWRSVTIENLSSKEFDVYQSILLCFKPNRHLGVYLVLMPT